MPVARPRQRHHGDHCSDCRFVEKGVIYFQQTHKGAANIEIRGGLVRVLNQAEALPLRRREGFVRELILGLGYNSNNVCCAVCSTRV